MIAAVDQALGDVHRRHAVLLLGRVVEDDLVQAVLREGQVVDPLQARLDVVGVEDRRLGRSLELVPHGARVGQRPHQDGEVAEEGLEASDGERQIGTERVAVSLLTDARRGQEGLQSLAHHDGARAGTSAAVRRGEGLVDVEVHHVDPHLGDVHVAHQGVHVGAVTVDQSALLVDDLGDLGHVALEDAQGVGIGQHDAGRVLVHDLADGLGGDDPVLVQLDRDGRVAANGRGRRVRAVRRAGHDHLLALLALVRVVGVNHQHPRQLALCARRGLEGRGLHSGELEQILLQLVHELEGALEAGLRHEGMNVREAGQRGHALVDLGVVLHGAGAQRVHPRIDPEVPRGEARIVTDDVDLGQLRQFRGRSRQRGVQLALRDVLGRNADPHASLARTLPQERFFKGQAFGAGIAAHNQATSFRNASISSRVWTSVAQKSHAPLYSG